MKTKQKLQEGLDGFKRSEHVNGVVNRAANHLFDAFREIEHAISHCDNPNLRKELEEVKEMIGRDTEIAWDSGSDRTETVIGKLQKIISDIKLD